MFHTAPIEVFFIPSRPARAPAEYGRMLLTGCSGPFDRLRVSDPGLKACLAALGKPLSRSRLGMVPKLHGLRCAACGSTGTDTEGGQDAVTWQ